MVLQLYTVFTFNVLYFKKDAIAIQIVTMSVGEYFLIHEIFSK